MADKVLKKDKIIKDPPKRKKKIKSKPFAQSEKPKVPRPTYGAVDDMTNLDDNVVPVDDVESLVGDQIVDDDNYLQTQDGDYQVETEEPMVDLEFFINFLKRLHEERPELDVSTKSDLKMFLSNSKEDIPGMKHASKYLDMLSEDNYSVLVERIL